MNSDRDEAALREFESLRSEIVTLLSRGDALLSMVWGGVAVLVAASAYSKLPELCFVAFVLAVQGWIEDLRRYDYFQRLGAYIEAVLEPLVNGLQWENSLSQAKEIVRSSRFASRRRIEALFADRWGLTTTAALSGWLILAVAYVSEPPWRIGLNVGLLAVSAGILAATIARSRQTVGWRREWLAAFSSVSPRRTSSASSSSG